MRYLWYVCTISTDVRWLTCRVLQDMSIEFDTLNEEYKELVCQLRMGSFLYIFLLQYEDHKTVSFREVNWHKMN